MHPDHRYTNYINNLTVNLINSRYNPILGVISIIGGIYLGYMAYESFKGLTDDIEVEQPNHCRRSNCQFLKSFPLSILDYHRKPNIDQCLR